MKYQLPEHFMIGSSASAWQTEGWAGKKKNQCNFVDMMYKAEPQAWYQGIGPKVSTDFYHRYREDISLMKDLGINVYRTSIDWSRFIRDYETNEVDPDAVKFYTDVIDCLKENGIEPMICLEHWEEPEYLIQKYGYWDQREIMDHFVEYGKQVFDLFHEKVKYWWTINEPNVVPKCSFLVGENWPYLEDTKMAVQMNFHRVLATSKLIQYFKAQGYEGKVGAILDCSPAYPKNNRGENVRAARISDLFNFRLYTDPLMKGSYSPDYLSLLKQHNCMFNSTSEDLTVIQNNPIMYVGLNYYQPLRVQQPRFAWNPDKPYTPLKDYEEYHPRGQKMNFSRGWEIYPKGIYDLLKIVQNEYGNIECFITENGMGVSDEDQFKDANGVIQDDYRIQFLSDHLAWVMKAIGEGVNCQGFLNWTFTDNLSPVNAFKNRYGFVEIDLNHNRERRLKKSGYWLQQMLRSREFDSEDVTFEYR